MIAHPLQLLWLAALLALALLAWRSLAARRKRLAALIEPGLIGKIFPFDRWRRWNRRLSILELLAFLFLILALAGPLFGRRLQEVQVQGSSVFILFDCSASMLAQDFKPDRAEKAKRMLAAVLDRLTGSRVGIIAFAGRPYVYCPVTFDLTTARQFLKSVEPGMIPQPGTHIGDALRLAVSKLPEGKRSRAVILLTDGEDHHSDPLGAAEEARKAGVRVFAVGIGSPEGEPIPITENGKVTGYMKDRNGKVVISRLGEETLAKMALATGGAYFRASESEQEIDVLADKLEELGKEPLTVREDAYENRYQWPLGLALLLLAAVEGLEILSRREKGPRLAGAAVLLLALAAAPVRAASFNGQIRLGNRRYKEQNYSDALQHYRKASELDPKDARGDYNQGTAYYRLKDWDHAAEEFQKSGSATDRGLAAKAFYDLGNSQFQKGQYGDAVKSYQQSLRLNPSDPDAKFNLQLALRLVRENPKQQKPKEGQGKNQKKRQGSRAESREERERKENAKRILQGAAGDQDNKPIFRPQQKEKEKNPDEEDW